MRRVLPILLTAVVASAITTAAIVLPAAADGGGEEPSRARIDRFEACMREQGFDLGQETTVRITPEGVTVNGEQVDPDAFRRAERECGGPPFLGVLPAFPRGELPDGLPEDARERLERLRDCLETERDGEI